MRRRWKSLAVKVWSNILTIRKPILAVLIATAAAFGALFVFAMGCSFHPGVAPDPSNYTTCNCNCSHKVVTTQIVAVFEFPGQISLSPELANQTGTVLDGPVSAPLNGQPVTWFQVSFNDQTGWVAEDYLIPAAETQVRKNPNVCLPAQFNPDLGGTSVPTNDDLIALCTDVSTVAEVSIDQELGPLGKFFCSCHYTSPPPPTGNYDASCSTACPNNANLCFAAGSDPVPPGPDTFSANLFQHVSTCQVSGQAQITVDGHQPKNQPNVQGVFQIQGKQCPPGQGCGVGLSYQLTSDDVEFESGSIFGGDTTFTNLSISGATVANAVNLGLLFPPSGYVGAVPADTAFSSGSGQEAGTPGWFTVNGYNTEGLALGVNWEGKACVVSGQLVGQVTDHNGNTFPATQVDLPAFQGVIVNQPPQANAGKDQVVECTSSNGATVMLDASASTDADNNISFYEWRRGSETGPLVSEPSSSPVASAGQTFGTQAYYVMVVDSYASADSSLVNVQVADNTPPVISSLEASPSVLWPPNHKMVSINLSVSAADVCDPAPACKIASVASNEAVNGLGDGDTAPDWVVSGNLGLQLRSERSGTGSGRTYTVTVQCSDKSGNTSNRAVTVSVPQDQGQGS